MASVRTFLHVMPIRLVQYRSSGRESYDGGGLVHKGFGEEDAAKIESKWSCLPLCSVWNGKESCVHFFTHKKKMLIGLMLGRCIGPRGRSWSKWRLRRFLVLTSMDHLLCRLVHVIISPSKTISGVRPRHALFMLLLAWGWSAVASQPQVEKTSSFGLSGSEETENIRGMGSSASSRKPETFMVSLPSPTLPSLSACGSHLLTHWVTEVSTKKELIIAWHY